MVRSRSQMEMAEVRMEGAAGVTKRVPVRAGDGWDGWAMRVFELAPGGYTPRHSHDWLHVNLVLDGRGTLLLDGTEHELSVGDSAVVPAGREHQFRADNVGFTFICIVPEEGEG